MIELLRKRRSTRKFTDKVIEDDKIKVLKEAALRSPSSRNNKPCEYVFVSDKKVITALSETKQHGSAFLKNATLCVVVCADESKSDVWVEDSSIATILIQLTAQSLDLGSCWVQVRKRQHNDIVSSETYVKELLKLPENLRVESIVGIGYPAEYREGVPFEDLEFDKIVIR